MILAIVQARMSSHRLPGKVLKPILGEPMLSHQIRRIQRSHNIDKLIVATSDHYSDNAIASLCSQLSIGCFRGSLSNVLERFFLAAEAFKPEHIVRLTGDCPVIDPVIIDDVISLHLKQKSDYCSNCHPATYPDGLDVEVMTWQALLTAYREAESKLDLEHVTPYIALHPERFRIANKLSVEDNSHLRWTVDEAEDFELINQLFNRLYPLKPNFEYQDMLNLIGESPNLSKINRTHKRNAGSGKESIDDI